LIRDGKVEKLLNIFSDIEFSADGKGELVRKHWKSQFSSSKGESG